MYHAYDQGEYHHEPAMGAGPPVGAPLPAAPPVKLRLPSPAAATWRERLAGWKRRIERRCEDLAPDLAEDIGSARWFRGLGTMMALALGAAAFWPDFSAVEAATQTADATTRDEYRSQMIMPLRLGADSGRRVGPSAAVLPLAAVPERAVVRLVATLSQGDSFGRMLQRAGVGADDAAHASELVAASVSLGEIAPGTQFDITLGRRGGPAQPRPLDRLNFRARFDLALAIERRGAALALRPMPIAVDTTPLRIQGTVGSSLYRSARAAGAPAQVIQDYLRALAAHVSLESDIAASDRFDIIVAYKRAASGEAQTGELLYGGLESGGKPKAQLLRWGKDGQLFEASGIAAPQQQSVGLFAPVVGHITSGFGLRRHPILGYTRMHSGIDFGAPWGAPIFAVSDGVVSYAGRHGGHGNYVRLEHGGGLGTGYGHMSRIAVTPGTRVHAGQVIGYVGSTGLSTGPHLHYELYQGGRTVDPMSVRFAVSAAPIDKGELAAFKARIAELKAIPPGAALQKLLPGHKPALKLAPKLATPGHGKSD